ncbi:MAG: hypothetical protein JNM66_07750 [Bryobacterales bacterium]|nr:hypothetical protein [Bryobacterales bacterium]
MEDDWIPVEWEHRTDLRHFQNGIITVHRTVSPHYPEVRYAVRDGPRNCLSVDGEWEYEPLPSERDAEHYRRFRFMTFEDAVAAAEAQR